MWYACLPHYLKPRFPKVTHSWDQGCKVGWEIQKRFSLYLALLLGQPLALHPAIGGAQLYPRHQSFTINPTSPRTSGLRRPWVRKRSLSCLISSASSPGLYSDLLYGVQSFLD